MIYIGPLQVEQSLAARTRTRILNSGGLEDVIAFLRTEGEGKIGTIRMLIVVAGLSLREAKRAVELSQTWSDQRESDALFHGHLAQVADALNETPVTPESVLRRAG